MYASRIIKRGLKWIEGVYWVNLLLGLFSLVTCVVQFYLLVACFNVSIKLTYLFLKFSFSQLALVVVAIFNVVVVVTVCYSHCCCPVSRASSGHMCVFFTKFSFHATTARCVYLVCGCVRVYVCVCGCMCVCVYTLYASVYLCQGCAHKINYFVSRQTHSGKWKLLLMPMPCAIWLHHFHCQLTNSLWQ